MLPRKRQSKGTPFTTLSVGPAVATNEERTSDALSIALIASLQFELIEVSFRMNGT